MMFYGCRSLAKAPELPAAEVPHSGYYAMFYGCILLSKTPILPAITLSESCYELMFCGCTSLEAIPALPAKKMETSCYTNMFRKCSKIGISATKTGEYQNAYRLPYNETDMGTTAWCWTDYMFTETLTASGLEVPQINTTYYTNADVQK